MMIKNHLQSHEFMMFSVVLVFAVIGLMMNYPASITGYGHVAGHPSGEHGVLASGGDASGVFREEHGTRGVLKKIVVRGYEERCMKSPSLDKKTCDQIYQCLGKDDPFEGKECHFIPHEFQFISILTKDVEDKYHREGLSRPEGLGESLPPPKNI